MEGQSRGRPHGHAHDHSQPFDDALEASDMGVRAVWVSLAGLGVTAVAQLLVVVLTGSVALLADTIHNFTDALTALPLLIAFRLGRRPPNSRYTYGYHRAEDLAGVVIVLMILASAVIAALEAVQRLRDPAPVHHVGIVLAAGVIGFLGNEMVALYRTRVGRRIGSAALVADGMHARADGVTSLGVVASALFVLAGFDRADPLIGLAITLAIAWTVVQAGRTVLRRILDGIDGSTVLLIDEVAESVPGVEHVSEGRARWVGHHLRAELTIDVDSSLSVGEGHDIAELVRNALLRTVPRLQDAMVHVDPHDHDPHGDVPGVTG
jgi:cation diffusion facilitator family transporter